MKALYDFLSIAIFFIVYKFYGFFVATAVINILLFIGMFLYRWYYGVFDKMQVGLFTVVLLLSIPTFFFHSEIYFKWKPTVVSWGLAIVLLFTQFLGKKKSLVQRALEKQEFSIPLYCFARINLAWAIYLIIIGTVNLFVAYHFNTDVWVNFKLFGTLGSSLAMSILTVVYLLPHIKHQDK